MYKYFPHTKDDVKYMLEQLKIKSIDELYSGIPKNVLLNKDYNIKSEMSEVEVREYFKEMSKENTELTVFFSQVFSSALPNKRSSAKFAIIK